MTEEDILFFRLRLPRELADMIADLAHDSRRPINSQVIMLLEKALGIEGRYAVTGPRQRVGASVAGSRRAAAPGPARTAAPAPAPAGTMSPEEFAELRRLAAKLVALDEPPPPPAPEKKKAAPATKRPVRKR